jgi:hypothetical protein
MHPGLPTRQELTRHRTGYSDEVYFEIIQIKICIIIL